MATTTQFNEKYADEYGIERANLDDPSFIDKYRRRWGWFDHLMLMNERYTSIGGNQFAAGITYFSVLSMFPLLMIVFAVAATVLASRPDLLGQINNQLTTSIGGELGKTLHGILISAVNQRGSLYGVGGITALWTGINWMNNLRYAVSKIWNYSIDAKNFIITKLCRPPRTSTTTSVVDYRSRHHRSGQLGPITIPTCFPTARSHTGNRCGNGRRGPHPRPGGQLPRHLHPHQNHPPRRSTAKIRIPGQHHWGHRPGNISTIGKRVLRHRYHQPGRRNLRTHHRRHGVVLPDLAHRTLLQRVGRHHQRIISDRPAQHASPSSHPRAGRNQLGHRQPPTIHYRPRHRRGHCERRIHHAQTQRPPEAAKILTVILPPIPPPQGQTNNARQEETRTGNNINSPGGTILHKL